MTTVPSVPATAVFASPPGVPAELGVLSEHGDVNVLVTLAGCAFCAVVLTLDDALDLSLQLCAAIMDARRQQGGAP
jgi:hypothetical protein